MPRRSCRQAARRRCASLLQSSLLRSLEIFGLAAAIIARLDRLRARGRWHRRGRFRPSIITFLHCLLRIDAQFNDANARGIGPIRRGWAMTDREDSAAREREEIVARVASFRATQQRFERDRQEYYDNT